jgi:hypothetical protein
VSVLRSRGVLRLFQERARHQAFPCDEVIHWFAPSNLQRAGYGAISMTSYRASWTIEARAAACREEASFEP